MRGSGVRHNLQGSPGQSVSDHPPGQQGGGNVACSVKSFNLKHLTIRSWATDENILLFLYYLEFIKCHKPEIVVLHQSCSLSLHSYESVSGKTIPREDKKTRIRP